MPVESLKGDILGFGALVRALVTFLDNKRTEPPLVMAINGPWGSGKSSIMRMLANELEATYRFRIAWFNAWRYHKRDQILAAFLQTVAQDLSKDWGVWFSVRLAWIRVRNANLSQLCLLSTPFVLLFIAWQAPELFSALGEAANSSQKGEAEQIAELATQGVTGVGGLAGLIWLTRFFLPFRVSYRKLFSQRDTGQHIGFLREFEREFALYRAAVGREKFLIMIDDLDRCDPDAVVEVLKAINLIVTSDAGAGTTFFVLGFDSRYILRSVEHHFKEFAKIGEVVEGRFGPQYLKKIVNIAVSVPEPDKDAVQKMVEALSQAGTQRDEKKNKGRDAKLSDRIRARLTSAAKVAFERAREPLPVFVFLATLVTVAVVWFGGERPTAPPAQDTAASTDSGTGSNDSLPPRQLPANVTLARLPESPLKSETSALGAIEATAAALALFGAALAFGGIVRAAVRARRAPREPDDSAEFIEAVRNVKDELPSNPRDVVRVVNRMRLAYLIQSPPKDTSKDYVDAFSGTPLDPDDSIKLTLLQQTYSHVFDPRFLDQLSGSEEGPTTDIRQKLDEIEAGKGAFAELATKYKELAAGVPALLEPVKLRRFISVNRFVLQRYEVLAGEEAEETGDLAEERESKADSRGNGSEQPPAKKPEAQKARKTTAKKRGSAKKRKPSDGSAGADKPAK